jgi:hypothetical protein
MRRRAFIGLLGGGLTAAALGRSSHRAIAAAPPGQAPFPVTGDSDPRTAAYRRRSALGPEPENFCSL